MKEKDFKLEKVKNRPYITLTNTDVDFADDIVILASSPANAESLLYSLERATGGLGLHINAEKNRVHAI